MNGTTTMPTHIPTPTEDPTKSFFVRNFVDPIGRKLDAHPLLHKIVVVVAHLFRMLTMLALNAFLSFGLVVNCIFSLAGSLFYRVAIERNCPFRFAIPSCLGAMALACTLPYMVALVAKVTFTQFMQALVTAIPFGIYLGYIIWSSHKEVNARQARIEDHFNDPKKPDPSQKSCCSA